MRKRKYVGLTMAVMLLLGVAAPAVAQMKVEDEMMKEGELMEETKVMEEVMIDDKAMSQGMMLDNSAMFRRMMGPLIGGVMVHAWIDLIAFAVAVPVFLALRGGKLSWPFAIIGLTEFTVAMMMFAQQPMWIASTIRSLLVLVMTVWFWIIFRPQA